MAQNPTPNGGPNQTLLELIYALKGLAQTVEFYHQDLTHKLDEESKARQREWSRIQDIIGKTNQSLTVLPITISDRVEKIVDDLGKDVETQVGEVASAISDVRSKLWEYMKVTERAISQTDAAVEATKDDRADITGKIEVTEKGDIKLQFKSAYLKKIWYGVILIATGGGVYAFAKAIRELLGLGS